MLNKLALELYSVREDTAKDFPGTLEKVAKMGYTGVEFAGFGGIGAEEMAGYLKSNGLECVSTHTGGATLYDDEKLKQSIQYHHTIGARYIICPYERFDDIDAIMRVAEKFNRVAEICNAEGLKFAFHNHMHEFEKINGEYIMDLLFKNVSPLVQMQLHVSATEAVGIGTINYMKKWQGRVTTLHLYPIFDADNMPQLPHAGNNKIDFASIIKYGIENGVTDFIYEQEGFGEMSMDCVAASAKYLLSL